jgi:hypothetical protein
MDAHVPSRSNALRTTIEFDRSDPDSENQKEIKMQAEKKKEIKIEKTPVIKKRKDHGNIKENEITNEYRKENENENRIEKGNSKKEQIQIEKIIKVKRTRT